MLPSATPKLVQCKSTSTCTNTEYTTIAKLILRASKKVNGGHTKDRVRSHVKRSRWSQSSDLTSLPGLRLPCPSAPSRRGRRKKLYRPSDPLHPRPLYGTCARPSPRLKVTVLPKATVSSDVGSGISCAVRTLVVMYRASRKGRTPSRRRSFTSAIFCAAS
jgi:hypothetical protein